MNTRFALLTTTWIALLALALPALAAPNYSTSQTDSQPTSRQTPEIVKELEKPYNWLANKGTDAAIYTRLQAKLVEAPILNNSSIKLSVKNRVVTLMGAVNNMEQLQKAVELANSDQDVVKVKTSVDIVNPPRTPGNDIPPRAMERLDNAATTAMIQAKLASEPALDGTRIMVRTLNDAVILEGSVHTWDQYNKATQLAKMDGVAKVSNRLEIKR